MLCGLLSYWKHLEIFHSCMMWITQRQCEVVSVYFHITYNGVKYEKNYIYIYRKVTSTVNVMFFYQYFWPKKRVFLSSLTVLQLYTILKKCVLSAEFDQGCHIYILVNLNILCISRCVCIKLKPGWSGRNNMQSFFVDLLCGLCLLQSFIWRWHFQYFLYFLLFC